jgi:hypothetical protein
MLQMIFFSGHSARNPARRNDRVEQEERGRRRGTSDDVL